MMTEDITPQPFSVPSNQALVMTTIGDRDYPLKTVPHCFTCQHQMRNWIETEIAKGRPYAAIWKGLPEEFQKDITPRAMSNHFKSGHMPMTIAINRAIVEERSNTVGRAIEEGTQNLIDHVVIAKSVMTRGFEMLAMGEISPDVKDTLAAAKFMKEIEDSSQEGFDLQSVQQVFAAWMEAVLPELSPEAKNRFGQRLNRHPVLAALDRKNQRVVEGEAQEIIQEPPWMDDPLPFDT